MATSEDINLAIDTRVRRVSEARLIITAVVVEGRSQAQVARDYGMSEAWVSRLVARYRAEGDTAFEPRSRRPRTRPRETPAATVELVFELRRTLARDGLDAGADTIVWHLQHHHQITISRAAVYRIVRRGALVVAEPRTKHRKTRNPNPDEGSGLADVSRHHKRGAGGN
ncbi:MAG: helix-turn-helix domain-containing protein [Microthrixaceae bacterium]|nr:helix-turn-helix domain-containing protein [Microthrixaceae bacterium]